MKISLQITVEDDNGSKAGVSIDEVVPIPLTQCGDFTSFTDVVQALSDGCREVLETTVTKCQRDADWYYDDLTYPNR